MVSIEIPGFPAEVGNRVELPDMAELLLSPQFQRIGAEDFRRHATPFQNHLLEVVPLRNDRRYVLIRMGVSILAPGLRSHTKGTGDWHIDGTGQRDHALPQERVFILSSPCSCLTEFNAVPFIVRAPERETRRQFTARVRAHAAELGIVPRPIEPQRVYTFTNHLHRAVEPARTEFRFFLRVRETDVAPATTLPIAEVKISEVCADREVPHMRYGPGRLTIFHPPNGFSFNRPADSPDRTSAAPAARCPRGEG